MSQYEAAPRHARAPVGRGRTPARELQTPSIARLIPVGILVLAAAAGLAWGEDGNPGTRSWLKYAVLASLVLAASLISSRAARPSPPAMAAIVALGGLAIWQTISIGYSAVPNLARDEALLTLLYLVVFSVPALLLRSREDRAYTAALVAAGSAGIAVFGALALVLRSQPEALFYGGRLNFPVSYPNAQAAFVLIGFWPALVVAARRTAPLAVRAIAVGGATAALCGWLLTQSKGGALGLIVSSAVVFGISRKRLRLLPPFSIAAVLGAIGAVPLTAPIRSQATTAMFRDSIHHAGAVLLWLTVAGCVAGALYALVDRRLELGADARALAGRIALVGTVLVLVGGPALYFVTKEGPGSFFSRQWSTFKVQPASETSGTHLLRLGSNRYDFWRVSLSEFGSNPIVGVGARGFGPSYLQKGSSTETPARAHSLQMDALVETGLIGALLLLAALLPPVAACVRRGRDELVAAGVLGGGVYFLAHSSVDWIWTFPAVGILAFLLFSAGARGPDREREPLSRRTSVVGAGAVVALAVIAFVPPWMAGRFVQRSVVGGAGVHGDIAWAKRLDPLSIEPYLAEARWSRSLDEAIVPLRKAVQLQPRSFAARYLLGINLLKAGRQEEGRAELVVARRLSPRDPYVRQALELAPYTRPPR